MGPPKSETIEPRQSQPSPAPAAGANEESLDDSRNAELSQRESELEREYEKALAALLESTSGLASATADDEPKAPVFEPSANAMSQDGPAASGLREDQGLDDTTGEFVPRKLASEITPDLQAMRDLANQSARHAIESCSHKRLFHLAYRKLWLALAAIVVSFVLMQLSTSGQPVTYVIALAALVAAARWSVQYLQATRQLSQQLTSLTETAAIETGSSGRADGVLNHRSPHEAE